MLGCRDGSDAWVQVSSPTGGHGVFADSYISLSTKREMRSLVEAAFIGCIITPAGSFNALCLQSVQVDFSINGLWMGTSEFICRI